MPKTVSCVGKKFGKLLVLAEGHGKSFNTNGHKRTVVFCVCECGKKLQPIKYAVTSGRTTSCGCYAVSIRTKHGFSGSRFYKIWTGLIGRCTNRKNTAFIFYGGKGVSVEWSSFQEFMDDMYQGYLDHVAKFGEKQTTIDRIDSSGNYSKINCRWATVTEQLRNTSRNVFFTIDGKRMTFQELSKFCGIKSGTLRTRVQRGMSIEEAMKKKVVYHNGFRK